MGMRTIEGVNLRGSVGEAKFFLEISPGTVARAARELDLRLERLEGEDRSPVEHTLMDALSGMALQLAAEASRFEVRYEWRLRNFRWDRQEKIWRLSLHWSELELLLDPQGACDRQAEFTRLAQELVQGNNAEDREKVVA